MISRASAVAIVATVLVAGEARAEGDAAGHAHHEPAGERHVHDRYGDVLGGHQHGVLAVSVGALAASYDTRLYDGDYRGVMAGVDAGVGRFGFGASLHAYQLERNGRREAGLGDVMVHVHAALVRRSAWSAGLAAMGSAPTGSSRAGLGMGHPMLMADAWIRWRAGRVALEGRAGYGRAAGGEAAHAEHGGGAWPLVAPMTASEVTHAAEATVAIRPRLAVGLDAAGAFPIGDGSARFWGGGRALWLIGSTLATIELQRGLAGDPFGTRVAIRATFRLR